jgi:hypothetical protein
MSELTIIERAAIALGADEGEKELIALSKKYTDIVEIKNPAGRSQCHAAAMELADTRIVTDKKGKTAREDANAFQKAVIAEVARRVAIIKPEEDRLLALRDTWDEARAAEKRAALEAEQKRVDGIKARIEGFMLDAMKAAHGSAAQIDAEATRISETVISLDEFGEFTGEAQDKRDRTVRWLRERHPFAVEHEAEQERLAVERAELERQRAEQEEKDRFAAAVRAAQEARIKIERDAEDAARRETQRKADEALREIREAHEAKMAAERAEIKRQQDAIAAAKAEQERIAREAREAAEAEERRKQEEADAADRAAEQKAAEEQAAAATEAAIRAHAEFLKTGPSAAEIIDAIAEEFAVTDVVALQWLKSHVWAEIEVEA